VRWNQPLDLLKIASRLRSGIGCGVGLLDCMKPDAQGRVPENWRPGLRRTHTIRGHKYPMRRIGLPYKEVSESLQRLAAGPSAERPTQVWITSLCSYWIEGVAEVCRCVRQALPDAQVVLLGQYARLQPQHATEFCAADLIVSTGADLKEEPAAFDLYGPKPPTFLALPLHPPTAIADVWRAVSQGIVHFTFFEDDVCQEEGGPLREIIEATHGLHKRLRYHFICGMRPERVTPAVARLLAHKAVAELHFEEADAGNELDLEAYRRLRAYLRETGVEGSDKQVSGFVWVGRPKEDLEQLILRSFQVLDCLGGLILKPYSPTPGSPEHQAHKAYLSNFAIPELSPHFFPFAELNGITREEYHDLYRMAAFLNEKVRDESFDFLRGTLGLSLLRESLRKEVWALEPSPLRVID
jgi:hypothetical protein